MVTATSCHAYVVSGIKSTFFKKKSLLCGKMLLLFVISVRDSFTLV